MIVVDIGCCPHEGDLSVEPLVQRFQPDDLYGFDPLLDANTDYVLAGSRVHLSRAAAWLRDGQLELAVGAPSPLDATVMREKNDRHEWQLTTTVPCFDLAEWLRSLPEPPVVKMNVEGAEFPLLEHLQESGAPVARLIVAWHDGRMGGEFTARRQRIERGFPCPLEEWTL